MNELKRFILIPNTSKQIPKEAIAGIADRLKASGGSVGTLPEFANHLAPLGERLSFVWEGPDGENGPEDAAAIVLGGDGSIIEASHRLLGQNVPILGVNYGRVGFLAGIEIGEAELLDRLPAGNYAVEERMMLDSAVTDTEGKRRGTFTVLNDIVLTNGPVARLISFDVFCDGVLIETCRADGMIFATPTGSTAYSLSAGGPVLDPSVAAVCATPICPHTLSSRPVIFRGDARLEIKGIRNNNASVWLNADGRDELAIQPGDRVEICRSAHRTRLIRVRDDGFLNVLRAKLSE